MDDPKTQTVDTALRAPTPLASTFGLGPVRLVVSQIERAVEFWAVEVGLHVAERADGVVRLGTQRGSRVLIELEGAADAPMAAEHATGLYHVALLVPTRRDLALALQNWITLGTPLGGASDHLVSEALYLDDLEGNGIELYRDRPRNEWKLAADGTVEMGMARFNARGVLRELDELEDDTVLARMASGLPAGTTIGHVHLRVNDLERAITWYRDILGLDVMARMGDSAAFLSAGGYHHHVGLNTWHSLGGSTPPAGTRGLRWATLVLRDADERAQLLEHVAGAGGDVKQFDGLPGVTDPAGNAWRIDLLP